jgi:hypothetical protein
VSAYSEITDLLNNSGVTTYPGYAPTGATLPYVVHRPINFEPDDVAIAGPALGWDLQTGLYCAAGSVEASFNLALAVMMALQGVYVAGSTIITSMGYSGAQVEGHYTSQVTAQLNQGGI